MRLPDSMGKLWLRIALIFIVLLFPAIFVLGGALTGNVAPFTGGFHWQCFAYSIWEQIVCLAIVITLLVVFRKRFNRQGPIARAASSSSYTTYIIHAPVIILFALAVRNLTLYPLLKFALVVLITVPLCFVLGNIIRKLPLARRIL
jgi:peptidoglycan/LPS O-acetylase OafA/YrhL